MTWLRRRVENPAKFGLNESSDKALSAKHAYQVEHERPDSLSVLLYRETGQELGG